MKNGLHRYLEKRAFTGPWQITGIKRNDYSGAIVIPACDEENWLFRTLDSLAANDPELLESFLILVVVNQPGDSAHQVRIANRRLLEQFTAAPLRPRLELGWIDACSAGLEIPGGGVGSARKLGFDLALRYLRLDIDPILVSLDADTLVEPNYLQTINRHFDSTRAGAAVIPYAHQPADNAIEQDAIDRYELYLRCYLLGLKLAGSPYAFHTIGSAMSCRTSAYLGCGGMNRRMAGEDFYFLQSLAKTAGVVQMHGTTVYPSARLSTRVAFGTGPALIEAIDNPDLKTFYPAAAFELLGQWFEVVEQSCQLDGQTLQARGHELNSALGLFLHRKKFAGIWDRLRHNHHDNLKLMQAFHTWFDGLKTQQLLKHLCHVDHFNMTSAAEAIISFFPKTGLAETGDIKKDLDLLRHWQNSPGSAGK